jgi:hypothetical protein
MPKDYSQRALSTFEIIAAFVVDIYYNNFYQTAKKLRIEGRVESVTEGYKHCVKSYISSLGKPKSYKKTVVGIHAHYYNFTRFSTITFSECIDTITKHFIPEDFFESSSNQQRDETLRTVLTNSIKEFSKAVLCSNMLNTVIEKHSDTAVIRAMQDKMVEALMFEREKMFQKIFNASNKTQGGDGFKVVVKMKKEMVKLVKKNIMMVAKYKKLREHALGLSEEIEQLKNKLQAGEPPNQELQQAEERHNAEITDFRERHYNAWNMPVAEHKQEIKTFQPDERQPQPHQPPQQPPVKHFNELYGHYGAGPGKSDLDDTNSVDDPDDTNSVPDLDNDESYVEFDRPPSPLPQPSPPSQPPPLPVSKPTRAQARTYMSEVTPLTVPEHVVTPGPFSSKVPTGAIHLKEESAPVSPRVVATPAQEDFFGDLIM